MDAFWVCERRSCWLHLVERQGSSVVGAAAYRVVAVAVAAAAEVVGS